MQRPEKSAEFFRRAGLPEDPQAVIGRTFRFFNQEDGGYELGGIIERYEIHGEFSINLYINKPDCYLIFSAVDPPRGDGVYRWKLVDTSRKTDREMTGQIELL